MDSFQGCFKDGTKNVIFSALYLIIQIAMHLAFTATNNTLCTLDIVTAGLLLACLQLYKRYYVPSNAMHSGELCSRNSWETNHLYSSDLDNQYVVLAPVLVLHVYPLCLMLILFGGGL